jgi:hypothetical protein
MTQHPFPMFVTPNEAGAPAVTNGYPAYLLGRNHVARTPSSDGEEAGERGADEATESDDPG